MSGAVLITGVSSGLGRGLAEACLAAGRAVHGCSRRRPDELVAGGLHHAPIDLAAGEAAAAALGELLDGVAALDAVFLNAGRLGRIRDLCETPLEDLRETMEVNLWANKWILDTVFRRVPRVAQVVGISSGASVSGSRGWNGYSLSKAALNMFIKLYAGERPKTHFTALAPGLVESAMQDYLCGLPADDRYPPLERLKAARGTADMPDARTAAESVLAVLPRLREHPSGCYLDIRDL